MNMLNVPRLLSPQRVSLKGHRLGCKLRQLTEKINVCSEVQIGLPVLESLSPGYLRGNGLPSEAALTVTDARRAGPIAPLEGWADTVSAKNP